MTTQHTMTTSLDDWGLGAPAPVEAEAPDDEPERELNVTWWQVAAAAGFLFLALAAVTVAVFFAARAATTPGVAPVQRASFTDQFGRQCTQVRAGNQVALDCDAKPLESRLGGALEGLGQ